MYVLIHELAHVLNDETGHGEKFIYINTRLLEYATKICKKLDIYNYTNYKKYPEIYCGMEVNQTLL